MISVSIIVPCYNQAAFLPKAIKSLQDQTFTNWECIIVDDGSTDETAVIAQQLCKQDVRLRLIQKENGGSASARDLGIKNAKGTFIQFLDADDTIAPEKLERQVGVMENGQCDISYTAFCLETCQNRRSQPRFVHLSLCKILTQWGVGASVPIHSFLYRTDFIRNNCLNFQNACRVREDWRWHILCFDLQPKMQIIPDYCGAIYYQNEHGKTGSYIRMQEGNFTFMAYMAAQLTGYQQGLWAIRISEEIWMCGLRMIKYQNTQSVRTISNLCSNKDSSVLLIAAILLMPLSLVYIIIYFAKTYLAR